MLVLLESPYAGDIERNLKYGRACLRDSLLRGEYPFASHLLYTQEGVLLDEIPAERTLGMRAGWRFLPVVGMVVVYRDFGISPGMSIGIKLAKKLKIPIQFRTIYNLQKAAYLLLDS